jgi:UDP-N-acetylmuramate: L-alanyl-gamma-D-glutamyl-meso-diaminopimelate ligase
MNIHLIAIGGSAMHNLAIAMHQKGYLVSGSDDEIVEPSRSRLQQLGLLPKAEGWFPEKIHNDLDAVILGMHARSDNPELQRARELGIPVYSYPAYIYEQSLNKTRIVIGGSHGKTSITAMILHVMHQAGKDCDYLVGAQLKGFDTMVRLSDAPLILLEGDEYLSSPLEPIPKFHLYHPHIALLSGIAWDHINVFPTFENYLEQFRIFIEKIEPGGVLIYFEGDEHLNALVKNVPAGLRLLPYREHPARIENGTTLLEGPAEALYPVQVFGKHNLQNINGARLVCREAGIPDEIFYRHIQGFSGAARRLELVFSREGFSLFKDFAHSPSKLKATTGAVKEQFPNRKLVACMELHTFSSLNENFLNEYRGSMDQADLAYVYFNPHTVAHKKLKPISPEQVSEAFGRKDLQVYNDSARLLADLKKLTWNNANLLMMSSGNFDGIRTEELPELLKLQTKDKTVM